MDTRQLQARGNEQETNFTLMREMRKLREMREMWRCFDCKKWRNGICQAKNAPRDGDSFVCRDFRSRTMERYFRIADENMKKHEKGK